VIILLVVIGDYFIGGYWAFFNWWLLIIILLMTIDNYYIGGY
jgi:hypothetical protein